MSISIGESGIRFRDRFKELLRAWYPVLDMRFSFFSGPDQVFNGKKQRQDNQYRRTPDDHHIPVALRTGSVANTF